MVARFSVFVGAGVDGVALAVAFEFGRERRWQVDVVEVGKSQEEKERVGDFVFDSLALLGVFEHLRNALIAHKAEEL